MISLSKHEWTNIYTFLCTSPGIYVKQEAKTRCFVEGILWVVRTRAQWRELPVQYGNWNSVAQRFRRWCKRGIGDAMLSHFASEPDLECLLLDSTVIRAHPCAAGAPVSPD